jgi:hypothetical protein
VTRVPVESGAVRSQHIAKQPYTLTIEAVISDIPVDPSLQAPQLAHNIAQSAVVGYFDTVAGKAAQKNQKFDKLYGKASQFTQIAETIAGYAGTPIGLAMASRAIKFTKPVYSNNDKFRVALSRLLELRESDTPFDYVSPLGVINNLVFEDLEIPVDTTSDLLFRARLVEFIETGITRTRSLTIDQEDASAEAANIGSRTTVEADFQALLAS